MLTDREKSLLHFIVSLPSSFNGDRVDLGKPFEGQSWEAGDSWWGYADLDEYVGKCGGTVNAAKGVLGSLVRKGFLSTFGDGGFIVIWKTQFDKILEAGKMLQYEGEDWDDC